MRRDTGLDTLQDMDGYILDQSDGYWVKIEARLLDEPTREQPHGISNSLTLHDPAGRRQRARGPVVETEAICRQTG